MHVHTPINNTTSSAYIPWVYDALLDQVWLNYTANHLVRKAIAPETTQDLTWGAFAAAALTSGITSQTPADLLKGSTNIFGNLYHGAVGAGLNRLFGVKEEQDWTSVVATAAGQSLGNIIAKHLKATPKQNPINDKKQNAINERELYLALAKRNRKSVTINGKSVSATTGTSTTGDGSTGNTTGSGSATVTTDSNGDPITTYSTTYHPADRGYEVSSNGDVYYPTRGNEDRIVINWHNYRQLYVNTQELPNNLDSLFKEKTAKNLDFRLLHGFRTANRDFRIEESKVRSVKQISDSASLVGFFGPAKQLGFKTADYAASKLRQLSNTLKSFRHGKIAGAATKVHMTEKYWIKNPNGPRSLEDAVNLADENGSFFQGIIDYHKIGDNSILIDAGNGLKVKFTSVDDKFFNKAFGKNKHAYYYSPKKFDSDLFDPTMPQNFKDLFGDVATVRIRQSVLESDRKLTAILGHEFLEVKGLYDRLTQTRMPYNKIPGIIDSLHNRAVTFGDNLVYAMMANGQ